VCRLNWLASISEVLELWVSAALTSYDNTPIIGSNDIGYNRSASNEVSLRFMVIIPPCFKTLIAFAILGFLVDSSD
jgi:hypothetical protein